MPQSIDAARVLRYAENVEHLFQQTMSRVRMFAQLKTGIRGSNCGFDLIAPSEMQDITGQRGGPTNWIDAASSRRWAPKKDFIHPILLDRSDSLAVITDMRGAYVRNGVMAANRKIDKVMIDAAYGTAISGEAAGSTVTFDTAAPNADGTGGNQIALSASGLTVDKMRSARQTFLTRNVGVDDIRMGVRDAFVWLMSGYQMGQLLAETEATSGDYVGQGTYVAEDGSRMPLEDGMIRYYMGFQLVVTDQLPVDSNSDRVNLCWHRDAMGLAVWSGAGEGGGMVDGVATTDSFMITVDRLPEHNNGTGIVVQGNFGSVRVQDKGVLAVLCDE